MFGRCAGFLGCEEGGSYLHAFRAEHERRCDSARVGDTSCGDDRRPNLLRDDSDERHRADERVFGLGEERAAMPTRFRARRNDHVDACLVQRESLVRSDSRADRDDPASAAGLQHVVARNTKDEAQRSRCRRDDRLDLLLERRGESIGIVRRAHGELLVEGAQAVHRPGEPFLRHLCLGYIVRGHPEVDRERARRCRAKLRGQRRDLARLEVVGSEGAQSTRIGHSRHERDARQSAAKWPLNDRIAKIEHLGDPRPRPDRRCLGNVASASPDHHR